MTYLKLDFDGAPPPADLVDRAAWLAKMLHAKIGGAPVTRRTRRGWHVVIPVTGRWAPLVIVAAQAILGSDRNREVFNLVRARRLPRVSKVWRRRWNVLYHHKVA